MATITNADLERFDKVFDRNIDEATSAFKKDVLETSRKCWKFFGIPTATSPRLTKMKAPVISAIAHSYSAVKALFTCTFPCCQKSEPKAPVSPRSTVTRV